MNPLMWGKVSMSREQALITAAKYNLIGEVAYCMDHLNMTPEEALSKWDILLENPKILKRVGKLLKQKIMVTVVKSFEELSPLKRQITGEKRSRIRISKPVRITEEEINSFSSIDTQLMRKARQLDKELPLTQIGYEYKFFGEWKPCPQSEIARLKESGFQIREVEVTVSRVKILKDKYHIKKW